MLQSYKYTVKLQYLDQVLIITSNIASWLSIKVISLHNSIVISNALQGNFSYIAKYTHVTSDITCPQLCLPPYLMIT